MCSAAVTICGIANEAWGVIIENGTGESLFVQLFNDLVCRVFTFTEKVFLEHRERSLHIAKVDV